MDVAGGSVSTALILAAAGALVIGAALGLGSRFLLRGRSSLGTAAAVLAGIVGSLVGAVVTQVATGNPASPRLGLFLAASLLGTIVVLVSADGVRTKQSRFAQRLAGIV